MNMPEKYSKGSFHILFSLAFIVLIIALAPTRSSAQILNNFFSDYRLTNVLEPDEKNTPLKFGYSVTGASNIYNNNIRNYIIVGAPSKSTKEGRIYVYKAENNEVTYLETKKVDSHSRDNKLGASLAGSSLRVNNLTDHLFSAGAVRAKSRNMGKAGEVINYTDSKGICSDTEIFCVDNIIRSQEPAYQGLFGASIDFTKKYPRLRSQIGSSYHAIIGAPDEYASDDSYVKYGVAYLKGKENINTKRITPSKRQCGSDCTFSCTDNIESCEFGKFGKAVASIGEISGDNQIDFAIADPNATISVNNNGNIKKYSGAGVVFLVDHQGNKLHTITPETIQRDSYFGQSISSIGPVVGNDRVPDLLIGQPGWDLTKEWCTELRDPYQDVGRVLLVNGATGEIEKKIYSKSSVSEITKKQERNFFGYDVSGLQADISGDNKNDIIVGAPGKSVGFGYTQNNVKKGKAYLISSDSNNGDYNIIQEFSSRSPEDDGLFGASVAPAGGQAGFYGPQILVGAPFEYSTNGKGSNNRSGKVYVFSPPLYFGVDFITSPSENSFWE